mmetsp:Transcript_44862/g.116203  ORF Transcript_44862/g.116203 Transcript_44862/m.116203 type:complete len:282 (+) Transcript_44862:153-998(+)
MVPSGDKEPNLHCQSPPPKMREMLLYIKRIYNVPGRSCLYTRAGAVRRCEAPAQPGGASTTALAASSEAPSSKTAADGEAPAWGSTFGTSRAVCLSAQRPPVLPAALCGLGNPDARSLLPGNGWLGSPSGLRWGAAAPRSIGSRALRPSSGAPALLRCSGELSASSSVDCTSLHVDSEPSSSPRCGVTSNGSSSPFSGTGLRAGTSFATARPEKLRGGSCNVASSASSLGAADGLGSHSSAAPAASDALPKRACAISMSPSSATAANEPGIAACNQKVDQK